MEDNRPPPRRSPRLIQLPPVRQSPRLIALSKQRGDQQQVRQIVDKENYHSMTEKEKEAYLEKRRIREREKKNEMTEEDKERKRERDRDAYQRRKQQVKSKKLTSEEQENFKNAIRLFPRKEDAAAYNNTRLKQLGYPIARVLSDNKGRTAENASSDEAKGLQKTVLLSKESRVMLRKNICTEFGLVNGSTGTVVDIVYANEETSPNHMPLAVMVKFDKYTGPQLYEEPNYVNVIPIVPITTTWVSSSGVTCQRTQLPLILCWAITVHKSQGLTLNQAVVDVGPKESLGLTFVALSRTRKLSDLAFQPMFSFERLARIGECKALPERRREEKRLQELSNATM